MEAFVMVENDDDIYHAQDVDGRCHLALWNETQPLNYASLGTTKSFDKV
jgi:hypothetical protein